MLRRRGTLGTIKNLRHLVLKVSLEFTIKLSYWLVLLVLLRRANMLVAAIKALPEASTHFDRINLIELLNHCEYLIFLLSHEVLKD